jgi:hypothetical protein
MRTREHLVRQLQKLPADEVKGILCEVIRRKRREKVRAKLGKDADVVLLSRDAELVFRHADIDFLDNLIGAIGSILDWQDEDRLSPKAFIKYHDGTEQWIDIFESIRNNATSIGHPIILQAIRRWEQIIRWNQSKGNKKTRDIAKRHLTSLGKAMLEGAKESKVDIAKAFVAKATSGANAGANYFTLARAWKLLQEPNVKKIKYQLDHKLNIVRKELIDRLMAETSNPTDEVREFINRQASDIADFLRAQGLAFLNKRHGWGEFLNTFDAWRFLGRRQATPTKKKTVTQYRSRAKLSTPDESDDTRFLFPETAAWFVYSGITDWFGLPTKTPSN